MNNLFQKGNVGVQKLLVVLISLVLLLYNFHRYIFKYNNEDTSPTYTNTPLVWQTSKYLLIFVLLISFYFFQKYRGKFSAAQLVMCSFFIFILFINILQLFIYGTINSEELQYCFLFLILIPLTFSQNKLSDYTINYKKLISFSAVALYIFNFIAIANYLINGRLPALGYEGGLVRFGSFWDDPNGFGFLCVFFLYYFFQQRRYTLVLISLINLLCTVSFSAYLLLFVSIFYWTLMGMIEKSTKWLKFSLLILLITILVISYYFEQLHAIYLIKEQSISDHLERDMIFNYFPLQNAPVQFSENWYESFFINYFPISVIYIGFIIYLFFSLFNNPNRKETKFFIFLFLLGNFFFSMLYIFPINFLFLVLLIDYFKSYNNSYHVAVLELC